MNTTVRMKQAQVYKDWHVIDAAGRPLGRVATEAAYLLKGKHKPTYEPHLDDGDFVIVVNASQVIRTGNKAQQSRYYRHSGYPGGLKSRTYEEMLEKFPERVLEQAIWGMLPKGPLGKKMFKHLKVYRGPSHPHQSQIAATGKAQEARKAALAELITAPPKLVKLRPLSVPQVVEEEAEKPAQPAKAASPAAAAASRARARVRGAEAAAPAEAEAEAPAPAPEATAPAEAPKRASRRKAAETEAPAAEAVAAAEAPKRTRRKAAEAGAEAATEEPKKPARRRTAAKSEGTEE